MRLENLVYYRSSGAFSEASTHYFVMTTDVASLHSFGALHEATLEELRTASDDPNATLCQGSNVDLERLELYARAAIAMFVPPLATQEMVPGQLSLFDFSERWQSNRAAMLVPASQIGGATQGSHHVLVTRVGDALQEPFWPEGLGINRGFLGALDCAHLVQHFAALRRERPKCVEECVARREELFGLTKVVSGHNRNVELRPHLEGAAWRSEAEKQFSYTIQPHTRYVRWGSKEPPKSHGVDGGAASAPSKQHQSTGILPVDVIAALLRGE